MAFNKRWSVTCPKCDSAVRSEQLQCKNCGRGEIKAEISRLLFLFPFMISHGCDRCRETISSISCPRCGCDLQPLVDRRLEGKRR